MKKLATYCGLLALAGAAFFVGEAGANYIYRYDNWVGVEPASLGRVKARFE
jgi:hypothetical protein